MASILMIEDNPAGLDLIGHLLPSYGHRASTAEDDAPGVAIVRAELPDLVLCDMQLPRVSGYQAARSLRGAAQTRAIRLVAISALAMAGDREQIRAAGFDGELAEPIVPETFALAVERFLQAPQHSVSSAQPLREHTDGNDSCR